MPHLMQSHAEPKTTTAVIAAGQALSAAVALPPAHYLAGVLLPSAWTAANLTFQASADGASYADLYDQDGSELTLSAAASRYVAVSPDYWYAVRYLKVRSGTSGTPVNQAAVRTIVLVVRAL